MIITGDFSIRNWLGILGGGASTYIIHTDMYGQIDIEITLDQARILMLGAAPITAAAEQRYLQPIINF